MVAFVCPNFTGATVAEKYGRLMSKKTIKYANIIQIVRSSDFFEWFVLNECVFNSLKLPPLLRPQCIVEINLSMLRKWFRAIKHKWIFELTITFNHFSVNIVTKFANSITHCNFNPLFVTLLLVAPSLWFLTDLV